MEEVKKLIRKHVQTGMGRRCRYTYDDGKRCIAACLLSDVSIEKIKNSDFQGSRISTLMAHGLAELNPLVEGEIETGDLVLMQLKYDDLMNASMGTLTPEEIIEVCLPQKN